MKYKIQAGTDTYNLLLKVKADIVTAQAEARTLLKELGGTAFMEAEGVLAGGISAIRFPVKKAGWKFHRHDGFFRPKETNLNVIKRISELPVVEYTAVNSILNFEPQYIYVKREETMAQVNYPALFFRKDHILLEVDIDALYPEPPVDVVEILDSEFVKIYNTENDESGL